MTFRRFDLRFHSWCLWQAWLAENDHWKHRLIVGKVVDSDLMPEKACRWKKGTIRCFIVWLIAPFASILVILLRHFFILQLRLFFVNFCLGFYVLLYGGSKRWQWFWRLLLIIIKLDTGFWKLKTLFLVSGGRKDFSSYPNSKEL